MLIQYSKEILEREVSIPKELIQEFGMNLETALFDQKIKQATEGLQSYYQKQLKTNICKINASIISKYIQSMRIETNLSDNHRGGVITSLKLLSEFSRNKPFFEMNREDVLSYLNNLRKADAIDPFHRWISTYNYRAINFLRFFKWLYSPNVEASKREKPYVVDNIPTIKRKETSRYRPSDLWTDEDSIVFLRYCVNKRDRCYHAMATDTSCRPSEILRLKISDIHFRLAGDKQYAEVVVNGKTGSRVIPLFNSIPFLKDWIEDHPQGRNPSALLFCGFGKRIGRQLSRYAIHDIYKRYKKSVIPSLLSNPNVPKNDKDKLSSLLKKPFNPYILRHSAITQKATFLKEHALRQHAGWAMSSKMPQIYIHWYGNESSESILEAQGIITKNNTKDNKMKPKQCPNCQELNKIDSKFCFKCRMVLTYDAFSKTVENENNKVQEQNKELQYLRERDEMKEALISSLSDKIFKMNQDLEILKQKN